MFLETPEFLTSSLHFITIRATPLHIFGIYCILCETPKTMRSAKMSLLNLHASCMALDWGLTVLSVPLLIFPVMGGYPLGILTNWFGVSTLAQIYIIICTIFAVITSIVLIFENRYYQVYAREKSWRFFRVPFMVFNYSMAFTHLIPACILVPDQKIAVDHVHKQIPNLPEELRSGPIFVLAIEYGVMIPFNAVSVIMSAECFLFIKLIDRNMNRRHFSRSEATVKLQKKFLKAIHAQVLVFFINLLLPMIYIVFSIMTDYYNQAANNLLFMFLALHGINSTSIMLWAHRPYREVCSRMLNRANIISSVSNRVSRQPNVSSIVLT